MSGGVQGFYICICIIRTISLFRTTCTYHQAHTSTPLHTPPHPSTSLHTLPHTSTHLHTPPHTTTPQAFIKDRFDPALFYGVFNRGAPVWLDGIIHSQPGRQLLYELSSTHKNCLLLNFAIQKILGKGFEDEVAKVGSRCVCCC